MNSTFLELFDRDDILTTALWSQHAQKHSIQLHQHRLHLFDPLLKGTLKRHSVPQELQSLLESVGLQAGRMKVNLLHRNTEVWRRYVIEDLAENVYQILKFIGRQRAKKRVAEGQRSAASAVDLGLLAKMK